MPDIHYRLKFKVAPERLYEACTDPESLKKWFAERIEIALDKNRYDFWGKHTPDNPGREEGKHRLINALPNRSISYEWKLRGNDTIVEYRILPHDEGSIFDLRHTGLPELKPYQSSIGDFWTHVLEGLRRYLENDMPHRLMDYSEDIRGDVMRSVWIESDLRTIFSSLIDPEQLNLWVARDAKVEPKNGGIMDFGWGDGPKKILEIVPNEKLSYSWGWADEPETVTTWTLEESDGGTKVTVVQSGFAPDRNSEDYYIGWHKFIYRLKDMLETGSGWERIETVTDDHPVVENK